MTVLICQQKRARSTVQIAQEDLEHYEEAVPGTSLA